MFTFILIFLLVLSVLVLVHEFGHFWAARKAGILVEEFGFGLPPRIWGRKIGETLFSINLLPFGGFVRLHGENSEEEITRASRAFVNKDKRTRALVVIAGVVMNFILSVVLFAIVYSVSGIPRETGEVKVVDISNSSPAQGSGLVVGDIVMAVNKEKVSSTGKFINIVEKNKGKNIELSLRREISGKQQDVNIRVKPRENPPKDEGPLGVAISTTEIYFPPIWQRPFWGVYYGLKESLFWGKNVIVGFAKIFTDLTTGQIPKDLAGPVGIFAITSEAAKYGILPLLNFVGILSINLAVLNIFPFPALDGGRLLFILVEGIFGRRVLPKIESAIHSVGMVILLVLIVAITAHDIQRLIAAGSLSLFLEGILK